VLPILAAKILGVCYRQRQTSTGRGTKEHLGVADASRINYFSQPVCQKMLTLNIFKLHNTVKLIYKYKKYIRHSDFFYKNTFSSQHSNPRPRRLPGRIANPLIKRLFTPHSQRPSILE
jgi:hypothetical protein